MAIGFRFICIGLVAIVWKSRDSVAASYVNMSRDKVGTRETISNAIQHINKAGGVLVISVNDVLQRWERF